MDPRLVLITGPTRSGKSEWAEHLAVESQRPVIYVATSQVDPGDTEWEARIQRHRQRRPAHWQLLEVPMALDQALLQAPDHCCMLVDSLGTWLANHLEASDSQWQSTCTDLLRGLQQTSALVILVAEETGWGVVPAYPLGRQFRDRLGQLTRQIAHQAQATYLVVAGHALELNQWGQVVPPGQRQP